MKTSAFSTFTALGTNIGGVAALALVALGGATAAQAQYRQNLSHDASRCASSAGPAVWVTINGIKSGGGVLRVQSYRSTSGEWLEKGRWLTRIEQPARAGTMRVCMPLPAPGQYGIAVRHDVNGNGRTDLSSDGGAMSNNPVISIWNLGKPSYKKVAFDVGRRVESISVNMLYR